MYGGNSGNSWIAFADCAASYSCALTSCLRNGFAASRPWATTVLVRLDGAGLDEVPAAFGGLGLDHHDRDILVAVLVGDEATGDGEVEDGLARAARTSGTRPTGPSDERETDAADRAVERQAGDLGRRGCRVDGEGVVELVRRDAQHGDDDLDLVAQALDEGRAQWTVDETADQDGLRRRATLAAEERAGDLACGVRALFDIHCEWEEVEAVTRALACRWSRDRIMVSSSRYAATAPCACCARRPVSNRTVRLPNLPLSRTASANLISGPSIGGLLLCC